MRPVFDMVKPESDKFFGLPTGFKRTFPFFVGPSPGPFSFQPISLPGLSDFSGKADRVSGDADAIIAQLEGYLKAGYTLILTSHYTPEDLKDVETKIAYLRDLKAIAASCQDGAAFKAEVQKKYPGYSGENYLDMTAGFFFA